jgi:hypothetical protein
LADLARLSKLMKANLEKVRLRYPFKFKNSIDSNYIYGFR